MKILALEFSTARRGVAVAVDGVVRGSAAEQGGRETRAFAMIESALHDAGVRREEIECVAVGIGPGSYAGIRMAIAVAQGWHLARGVKLLGIAGADAVAQQAFESGMRGGLLTVLDAQRGELFAADYELADSGWSLRRPFALLSPEDERAGRAEGKLFVRIDLVEHSTDRVIAPEAGAIARLASARNDFVTAPELEPVYVRKAEFVKAPPARFG
jgi:tRNA threonylcarbamoyl adenosine modification protein YeaZ